MIKATGMVRKIDRLGRIVVPIELRRVLGIEIGDGLEMYLNGQSIVLQEYIPACIFCGNGEGVKKFKGKMVCKECVKAISVGL